MPKRKSRKKRKKRGFEYRGPHHIIPRSRGGSGSPENIYPERLWPSKKQQHIYWHYIFENMRPDEAVRILEKYTDQNGNLDSEFFRRHFTVSSPWKKLDQNPKIRERTCSSKLAKRNKESWNIVFPGMNGHEAIEWIEREFIRKEWLNN